MAVAQRISEQEYENLVLSGETDWELHDGRLVEKPGMTWEHLDVATELLHALRSQLDRAEYRVFGEGRVRRERSTIFKPDVVVVPADYGRGLRGRRGTLAVFTDPLPLVVEIWSASSGDYDVDTKIPIYQQRGDREIWRIHPYDQTLTRWIRQADGSCRELVHRGGIVALMALPGVTIDLDALFVG